MSRGVSDILSSDKVDFNNPSAQGIQRAFDALPSAPPAASSNNPPSLCRPGRRADSDQIDILDPETHTFHQTQAATVQNLSHELVNSRLILNIFYDYFPLTDDISYVNVLLNN
jgi:hypothetical protein